MHRAASFLKLEKALISQNKGSLSAQRTQEIIYKKQRAHYTPSPGSLTAAVLAADTLEESTPVSLVRGTPSFRGIHTEVCNKLL
ncbi:MAG TPA: hypothetical protein VJ969_04560, partial [Desulfopila sp.]|nr:hypothetical protein [Desulfopila sp.]